MKPIVFWSTRFVFVSYWLILLFAPHHSVFIFFGPTVWGLTLIATKTMSPRETHRQNLTTAMIGCLLFGLSIPFCWSKPTGDRLTIIAAFIAALVWFIVLNRKAGTQAPLPN
jgi:hypothetical protein